MFSLDTQGILRADAFSRFPWLEHGFQTRASSHMPHQFAIARVRQIHSDRVCMVDDVAGSSGEALGSLGEADALTTRVAGILLTIRTADCVPLLLVDPVHRAVSAVHAGWRGTVAGIVPKAVETMKREYGTKPAETLAAIGPCIRRKAFEVGPEVAVQFRGLFPERDDLDGRTTVDLVEACVRQLAGMGVPKTLIYDCGRCSFEEAEAFHSFRRDREASGRMVSFVGIR